MEGQKFQDLILKQLKVLTDGQSQMQGNISSMQNDILELRQGQSSMQGNISELRQIVVRMENNLTTKITALFDAREAQQEVNERIITSLEKLEKKVDFLEMETARLKRIK